MSAGEPIVNGTEALDHEYPYYVAVLNPAPNRKFRLCGGSIIDKDWVLTAAHCIVDETANTQVVPRPLSRSEIDSTFLDGSPWQATPDNSILHPSFTYVAEGYPVFDLALLHIPDIGSNLASDQMATYAGASPPVGTDLWAVGFGDLGEDEDASETLQKVSIPLLSDWECNSAYDRIFDGRNIYRMAAMLCANDRTTLADTCKGDSGGPLVQPGPEGDTIVGITSWGRGCADPDYPGVYTEVASFAYWIESVINK